MTIEDLPETVKRHILERVTDGFERQPNRFYLTELLYCLRKAYFQRKLQKPITLQHAWYLYRGDLFDDAWTPLFKHSQIKCTHRVPDAPIVIVARADFIDDDGAVADLKTHAATRYLKEPKPEHVKQVLFYAWTNAIDKARLYYVDFSTCKVFDIDVDPKEQRKLVREIEERAKTLYNALQNDTPPPREESWICKSCEYRKECREAEP